VPSALEAAEQQLKAQRCEQAKAAVEAAQYVYDYWLGQGPSQAGLIATSLTTLNLAKQTATEACS
jgi:hypothetical protein